MPTILLPSSATGCGRRPIGRARSGAGWFEQRQAGERGRESFLAEDARAGNEIGRQRHSCRRLSRHVGQAVAAVAGQLLLMRIGHGAPILTEGQGRPGSRRNIQGIAGAVDQRQQHPDRQQQHQRQPGEPASECCARCVKRGAECCGDGHVCRSVEASMPSPIKRWRPIRVSECHRM